MPKKRKSRQKKRSLTTKIFFGLGKGVAWVLVNTAKALYYTAKGIVVGVYSMTKKAREKAAMRAAMKPQEVPERPLTKKAPQKKALIRPIKTNKGSFQDFEHRLLEDSLVLAVAGRRGSGKSVLGFSLLENIYAKTDRPCFALGVRQSVLPSWITSINSLDAVKNGGLVLVDEGAVSYSSRSSMSTNNRELGKLLAVARHKDLTLIFITQNTGMIDKNVLNLCDTVVFKEGSLLQEKMERSAVKDMYKTANLELKKLPVDERIAHCYVFDSDFEGVLNVSLPSFWSSKVSKSRA